MSPQSNSNLVPQVLIVDDEPDIVRMYADTLRHVGYSVLAAGDGATALALARAYPPDVILLDVLLPGPSGLELLPQFRLLVPDVPILILSVLDEADIAVTAIEQGAYTYLTKERPLREVVTAVTEAWQSRQARSYCSYGDLTVDLRAQRVRVADVPVVVTPYEWAVLACLAHAEDGVSYDNLWAAVWEHTGEVDKDLIQRIMSNLRQKIGAEHLETVRGWGYRLQ